MDTTTPLFSVRAFRLLFTIRSASGTASQMQSVAIGWQVYLLTGSPFHLGMIGLVQFVAPFCLALIAGQVVDRYDRRLILRSCYGVEAAVSVGLLVLTLMAAPPLVAIYILLLINSLARAFEGPALQTLLPIMVPRPILSRAVAAYTSAHKASQLMGPALGGILYGFGGSVVYSGCVALVCAAAIASLLLPIPPVPADRPQLTWHSTLAGFAFIRRSPILLGCLSLDLVSNFFGSVVALLPIFAADILHVGAWGHGMLRSAPAVGSLMVAGAMARWPVRRAGGVWLFAGFAIYGGATLAFALSDNFIPSLALLVLVGAGDLMSAIIRQIQIQVSTPDGMRGRVYSVNSVFVMTGGQLGQFESGVTAAWFGTVGSCILGGAAVLVSVGLWAWMFPALRRLDRPDVAPEIEDG
jgi:MFS family permease